MTPSRPATNTSGQGGAWGLSRRSFLGSAAGLGALAALSPVSTGQAFAAAGSGGLPSADQVWDWQHQLVGFGTRYTGGPGHVHFVDWIAAQLAKVPGFQVRRDRHSFGRWLAQDWSMSISQPATVGASGPVPLAYYLLPVLGADSSPRGHRQARGPRGLPGRGHRHLRHRVRP